ncbi:MAG: hypothetical protein WDW36_004093 [Sanguina aurantia]
MGASGAGKTTLLDVLACNTFGGEVEGEVLANGAPRNRVAFASTSCYVQQRDVLLCSATVREAITCSALLKLPTSVPLSEKRARVERLLKELDILVCANTLIGDDTIGLKGISGGQKRRVSVGIELVKDPSVLFLDEPTSGLDSEMACSVMAVLGALARKERTVVCTIHQPNSDITDMFDDFMLMAGGEGRVPGAVGERRPALRRSRARPLHYRCVFRCPMYKNPTDFFLTVIRDVETANALADFWRKCQLTAAVTPAPDPAATPLVAAAAAPSIPAAPPSQPPHTATAAATTPTATPVSPPRFSRPAQLSAAPSGAPNPADDSLPSTSAAEQVVLQVAPAASLSIAVALQVGSSEALPHRIKQVSMTRRWPCGWSDAAEADAAQQAPMWQQVTVLSQRNLRSWIRSPVLLASELIQYLFISIFIGLMYVRLTKSIADGAVFDRAACIWFLLTVLSFTPSYTAITNWDSERVLLRRELGNKLYRINAFYLARLIVLLPFQLLQCALFVLILYFFVGFQPNAANFFMMLLILFMFQVVSEGLGFMCALMTRQATFAIICLTFLLLILLSFSGFLISKTPIYFQWVQRVSYLTYAYSALLRNELTGLVLINADGSSVAGETQMPTQIDTGLSVWGNIGVLAGLAGGMEVIKLTLLHLAAHMRLL